MRIVLSSVLLIFLLSILDGCASQEVLRATKKRYEACKREICLPRYHACVQQCENNCQNCHKMARRSAIHQYNRYKHEHCITGAFIGRESISYRDPLECRKVTCNCMDDYSVCAQACDGNIQKKLQVASVCC